VTSNRIQFSSFLQDK